MPKPLLTLLISLLSLSSFCQEENIFDTTNTVYDLVAIEDPPEYPGGQDAMMKFLSKNSRYPDAERKQGIQGKVFVTFVIDKKGNVTHAEVYKGVKGGPGLDEEGLRLVNMMPRWKPGKQNGKLVRVRYILPLHFKL